MSKQDSTAKKHPADFIWDLWCIASIIGIWPRYIEPNLLSTTRLSIKTKDLPQALHGLKILQFSDLHWHERISPTFLDKLLKKAAALQPDLIVFTGDFLCYSILPDPEPLKDFLSAFDAPYGCYAVLGNHDYEKYVSVNEDGDYDTHGKTNSPIKKGWKRLLTPKSLTTKTTDRVRSLSYHHDLIECLKQTPFQLLHNETTVVRIKDSALNICGLGEHMLGRCLPELAYQKYDRRFPGIVLLHNPDGLPSLKGYPGDLVLCGHTHGGQVNIFGLSNKFMFLENPRMKRGLINFSNRHVYVNRGTGSVMPFRWFSTPELLLLTLEGE